MRPTITAFVFLALWAISGIGASAELTPEQFDKWLTYYYLKPAPELTPSAIDTMSQLGYLGKAEAAAPLEAFLSFIFRDNGKQVCNWLASMKKFSKAEQKVLIHGLWLANTTEARGCLNSLLTQNKIKEKEQVKQLLAKTPVKIEEIDITYPAVLDMLWGAFMATGEEKYVLRIISALPYAKAKGNVGKMTIGQAARWSLESNCIQHDRVYQICLSQIGQQPEEISEMLSKITRTAQDERQKPRTSGSDK